MRLPKVGSRLNFMLSLMHHIACELANEIEFSDAGVERPLLDELDPIVLDAQLAGVRVHGAPLEDADLALLH